MTAFGKYLEQKQPLVFRTFKNALETHKVNHAYLLMGEAGTPLKETALFLAKSLLCEHPDPFADEMCRTCERIDHGNYTDLILIDGSVKAIDKDSVGDVISGFSETAIESKGIMVYIIHLVENMTTEATNSLLKFLEEPGPNTYAFLTTENSARVLPTIVSRCETMRLLLQPRSETVKEAVARGVDPEDAEILSYFCNSSEVILSEKGSEAYQNAKTAFESALEGLNGKKGDCIFAFEHDVAPLARTKESARYFLDMLSLAYKDMIALSEGRDIVLKSYAKLIEPLAKKTGDPKESLRLILEARGELDLNINVALLLDHVAIGLSKEFRQ
jgi:DNA polymerase-3 subunit delta'